MQLACGFAKVHAFHQRFQRFGSGTGAVRVFQTSPMEEHNRKFVKTCLAVKASNVKDLAKMQIDA